MLPVQNDNVESLDSIVGEEFKELYVRQIVEARDSVMRNDLNVTDNEHIQAVNLNRRTITKEKLVSWLETVCYILDSFSVPLLENAVPILERIEELKTERIEDQSTIIELQQNAIKKNDEELVVVQTTVQTEKLLFGSIKKLFCCP